MTGHSHSSHRGEFHSPPMHGDLEHQGLQHSSGDGDGAPFRIREVANSQVIMANVRQESISLRSNGSESSSQDSRRSSRDRLDEEDDTIPVPMLVQPRVLHQNPQTPTVLPSAYNPINAWSRFKHNHLKEFLAEFLGTMVLVFFGDAVGVQAKMSARARVLSFLSTLRENNLSDNVISYLQYLATPNVAGEAASVSLTWAGAVTLGFCAAGGSAISGGHLNPAVTLANYVFRGLPAKKVPIYWLGQMLGGYCGGLLVYWYYGEVIRVNFEDWRENDTVISCFSVVALPYLTSRRQFISEFVIAALLIACLFSMTDPYTSVSPEMFPFLLFVLIFCLIAATGYQTGAALNPARDIGPRLAMWTVGFDPSKIWANHHHLWWVTIVGPMIGGIFGGFAYDFLIFQGHESLVNQPLRAWGQKFRSIISSVGLSKAHHDSTTSDDGQYLNSEKEIHLVDTNSKTGITVQHRNINFVSPENTRNSISTKEHETPFYQKG